MTTIPVERELLERLIDALDKGHPCIRIAEEISVLLSEQPQVSAAQSAPDEREAVAFTAISAGLPDDEVEVVIYTDGTDFAREQFFHVRGSDLNPNYFDDEEFPMREECKAATHWVTADDLAALMIGAAWQRAQSAPVVPEGWRLVPVDPTPEMLKSCRGYGISDPRVMEMAWGRMLAAAPAQPAAQELCNCPGGSKPEPHKHAPNCPYRTGAAAQDRGEVQRLREALEAIKRAAVLHIKRSKRPDLPTVGRWADTAEAALTASTGRR